MPTSCSQTPTIEPATRADLPEILGIYNEVIRNSTAVYAEEEWSAARIESWFDAKAAAGWPLLVAREAKGVVGFGTFGEFRAWPCYSRTVEHSVHVHAEQRGRGVGRLLVRELIARAKSMHKHVLLAGIDADNAPSIGLHESLGFRRVGHLHQVGFKFGRWLDLEFLELLLS